METRSASDLDYHTALALLEWQIELGVDCAICETPQNAYEVPDRMARPDPPKPVPQADPSAQPDLFVPPVEPEGSDPVAVARAAANGAGTLEALRDAVETYDLCELKKGARNTVFADGNPAARVMIIGEAPGRDEDLKGRPFVGRAGQLLDRMLAAIGLDRTSTDAQAAVYITNVLPWRPPGNRDPSPAEIAQMLPFLTRHVELADPGVVVLMGNAACAAALGKRGILRLRGTWMRAFGCPALPMTHPAYLLRNPVAKREAWADLLEIRARLDSAD